MSARPRPVTATIKPACMAPPVGVRERNYSLSSGSSTASLVSVLNHDSYESLGSECEDSPVKTPGQKIHTGSGEKNRIGPTETEDSLTAATLMSEQPSLCHLEVEQPQDCNGPSLSWEKWLVQKTKEERQQQHREAAIKKKEEEEKARKKATEEEKARKGEEKYKEWLEKKTMEIKIRQQSASRQKKTQEELEQEAKEHSSEKAKQKYQDWLNKKKTVAQENKKRERENKKIHEEKKKERQEKCNEAYENWCKSARSRPKSACSSYGYASGKLTGYYDTSAPSPPSFYNPEPWHPIAVPKPKTEKKRPKSKYRWNPDKYL